MCQPIHTNNTKQAYPALTLAYVLDATKAYFDLQLNYLAHYEAALHSEDEEGHPFPLYLNKEHSAEQLEIHAALARQLKVQIDREMLRAATTQARERRIRSVERFFSLKVFYERELGSFSDTTAAGKAC